MLKQPYVKFFSVHNCYAYIADIIIEVKSLLWSVYQELYFNNIYVKDFDNFIINNIQLI